MAKVLLNSPGLATISARALMRRRVCIGSLAQFDCAALLGEGVPLSLADMPVNWARLTRELVKHYRDEIAGALSTTAAI